MCKSIYILKFYAILYTSRWNANATKISVTKINVRKIALCFLSQTSTQKECLGYDNLNKIRENLFTIPAKVFIF